MRGFRHHLTYANVMVTVLAFVVFAGGAAYAANTIFSADIVDGQVRGVDIGDNQVGSEDVRNQGLVEGGLTAIDIQNSALTGGDIAPESLRGNDVLDGTIRGAEVGDESLTGTDVDNQSGVDTCTHGSVRFGELCFFDPDESLPWRDALARARNGRCACPASARQCPWSRTTTSRTSTLRSSGPRSPSFQPLSDGSHVFRAWVLGELLPPGFSDQDNSASVVCVTTQTN